MTSTEITFWDGENRIKIGQEVSTNGNDTEQWVSLAGYDIEVTHRNGQTSFAVYQGDEWNHGSSNLLFTIRQEVTA
jgi:hypothetical protein